MKKRGFFITFEGIEGSGKTTQIKQLALWLKKRGRSVLLTREPGGTPLADKIRSLVLDARTKGLTPSMELFLYEVARKDHVEEVIRPALRSGKVVLCDRFTDATLAYQGFARGLSLKTIANLNKVATGGIEPNLTFLFDLSVQEGLKRAGKRIRKLKKGIPAESRFEKESLAFHEKVRQGYLTLARRDQRKKKTRFKIIDASQGPSNIFHVLCREVERKF